MNHHILNAIELESETGIAAPDTLTARLLRAAHTCAESRHLDLYREILRRNGPKEWDTSELIALSAKLSPGKLHRNRYDSAVEWTAAGAASFYTSVSNAAPTDAVAALLERPGNYVAEWIRSVNRSFSYLAVEYDSRVYKIYLFDPVTPAFLDEQELDQLLPNLHASSYIDCLEINLDQPARHARPVYFKLRAPNLAAALEPDYRPHPRIENRVLRQIADRERVVGALSSITAGLRWKNDPVIKLRYVPGRLAEADYGISVNTFDQRGLKRLNDYRAEILRIAEALACREAVLAWLDAIRPFDCFISYLCIGNDFVTFYYKSTALSKKQPATFGRSRKFLPLPPSSEPQTVVLKESPKALNRPARFLKESPKSLNRPARFLSEQAVFLKRSRRRLCESVRPLQGSVRLLSESLRRLLRSARLLSGSVRLLPRSLTLLIGSMGFLNRTRRLLNAAA